MDEASQSVIEQGGMPSGDVAEKALEVISKYVDKHGSVYAVQNKSGNVLFLPPDLFGQLGNIRRCLIAFLALMRMHEAKKMPYCPIHHHPLNGQGHCDLCFADQESAENHPADDSHGH